MLEVIASLSLLGGFFFLLVGAVGMLRLPDVFTRMHAMGKCDTLGAGMILFAMFLITPGLTEKIKITLVGVLIATINPVMTHMIARVVYKRGGDVAPGTWVLDDYDAGDDEEGGNTND